MTRATAAQERTLRLAARALGRAGLVHAYGHASLRLDETHFLVCAAQPMSTITSGVAGTVVPVTGPLPSGVLGEVRIHQQIYARRSETGAVCRIMPPHVMGLSILGITSVPRHGFGAFFAPQPPFWDDPSLLRDDGRAGELADQMGLSPAIVMRANGAVVAGADLVEAVALSWFLEEAARIEHYVRLHGDPAHARLNKEETLARQDKSGRVMERMWEYLTHDDPEARVAKKPPPTPLI